MWISTPGTWYEGRGNSWREEVFDGSDLRGAVILGGEVHGCSFQRSRLDGAEFNQVNLHN